MSEGEPPRGWRDDREHKFVVGLEVTVDERLAWLEEMLELAHASGALPKRRDAWGNTLWPRRDRPGTGR